MNASDIQFIQQSLADASAQNLERLARQARDITRRHFGSAISLYAPLYLANFCDNQCVYCGFQHNEPIRRTALNPEQMRREMQAIRGMGIRNILLLTGESRKHTPLSYIGGAATMAREFFSGVHLEIYPLEVEEYRELYRLGADGVTIYQETYDRERYRLLHTGGRKRDYEYRRQTPERIARAGLRFISLGVLLGLSDPAQDAISLFQHLEWLERHYPGVEYGLSFPRLAPLATPHPDVQYYPVPDVVLVTLICLARILFPRVGITLSTRENAGMRDHAIHFGVTRLSAASRTVVGGYAAETEHEKDPQFQVRDDRSVKEIADMLRNQGFDPVFTDWRPIQNS